MARTEAGVGVIGLGTIGSGVARHLAGAGHRVVVCDLRGEAVTALGNQVTATTTPAELAAAVGPAGTVVVAVVDDAQVDAVISGPDGLLAASVPDLAVLVLSTVAPSTVVRLAAQAAPRGTTVLDCGVSGGPSAAAQGQLVCMLGGDQAAVSRVQPVLTAFASEVIRMGPTGAGMAAKLARNVVQYGAWLAAYEGQQLAESAGVPVSKLARAIEAAEALSGGSTLLMFRGTAAPFADDADPALVAAMRAGAALARKDLEASLALAEAAGLELPLTDLTRRRAEAVFGVPGPAATEPEPPAAPGAAVPDTSRPVAPEPAGRATPHPDRLAGMAQMAAVYGFSVDPEEIPGPYVAYTVDHLFGDVWNRPGLDIKERRLVVIGVLAALGQYELLDVQFTSALARQELTVDQLRELVLLLAHYAGWPLSKSVNDVAERVIARRSPSQPAG